MYCVMQNINQTLVSRFG